MDYDRKISLGGATIFRVRIVHGSNEVWYSNMVGEVIDVVYTWGCHALCAYLVEEDYRGGGKEWRYVSQFDCEMLSAASSTGS